MKLRVIKKSVVLLFAFINISALAQLNEIRIEFKGNCGLYLTDGITNIYTDFPYKSGAFNYMEYDKKELDSIKNDAFFIFTHKHPDHYSSKHIKPIIKEKGGQQFGVSNIQDLDKLNTSISDFEITAFKTKHKVFGISFKHYSYLIKWHGKRIYLSGDTTDPKTIANVKNLDWAFVPYWLLQNAKEQKIEIDADMFGIYHLYPEQIPSAKENWDAIENKHPLTNQNEVLVLKY